LYIKRDLNVKLQKTVLLLLRTEEESARNDNLLK